MKLVKVLSKTPVVGIDKELTLDDFVLISEDRFTLLQQNHVKFKVIKNFSEVAVRDIGKFDKTETYILADVVKPSEFSSFDPSTYEIGDYVFVFADLTTPKHPGKPPVMRKPEVGYNFTIEEYMEALNEYNAAMEEYKTALDAYNQAVEEFITTGEASYEEFGWLIRIENESQYFVIADFSFETTKDTAQFGVMGKLPKEVATKVTQALGGFIADDSIRGMTVAEIIEKALGLEAEEELVGQYLPKT
jgi:hypothetical protein